MSGVQYGPDACPVHRGHCHSLNADGVEICWVRETTSPCDIPRSGRWITDDELREIEEAAYRRGEESR